MIGNAPRYCTTTANAAAVITAANTTQLLRPNLLIGIPPAEKYERGRNSMSKTDLLCFSVYFVLY